MNRRDFFRKMIGGVAAAAAVRTWPFRVFSFPSQPVLARGDFIIPYSDYFYENQMIAAYGPDGGFRRGVFRIKHIDAPGKRIFVSYEEPRQFNLGRGSFSVYERDRIIKSGGFEQWG